MGERREAQRGARGASRCRLAVRVVGLGSRTRGPGGLVPRNRALVHLANAVVREEEEVVVEAEAEAEAEAEEEGFITYQKNVQGDGHRDS